MSRAIGIIVSDTEPSPDNYDLWLSTIDSKWREYINGTWIVRSAPLMVVPSEVTLDTELDARMLAHEALPSIHHPQEHSHPTHGDINFTGTVSAAGVQGLTGQRTVGGWKIIFSKGLLVGFEPV